MIVISICHQIHFTAVDWMIFITKFDASGNQLWAKTLGGNFNQPTDFEDALKENLDAMIDLLALKKTGKIIADARNMKVISEPDRQWIVEDWYPRALKAGFRYEALAEWIKKV
jgi:hypothetical protein